MATNPKLPGFGAAHGHWSRSTWARVEADQTPAKIRVALEDKLIARGRAVGLWLPVVEAGEGTVACTCKKDTTGTADRACNSCHGAGLVPGYRKFLTETLSWSSAEILANPTAWTLARCALDTTVKPFRVLMNAGETQAQITGPAKVFSNSKGASWEARIDSFLRAAGNAVSVDWTADGGERWFPLSRLDEAEIRPTGEGEIQVRITLTRSSASDRSPAFEIVRLRHVRTEDIAPRLKQQRPDLLPGQVIVAKMWAQEKVTTDASGGLRVDHMGDRAFTAPLDFFDTTLERDTPSCRIRDDEAGGPHPFFELQATTMSGTRYAITAISASEQFGMMTHQAFVERKAMKFEPPYGNVF